MSTLTTLILFTFLLVSPSEPLTTGQSDASGKTKYSKQPSIVVLPVTPDGASRVWLNTSKNLYQCSYERQYGRSKRGESLSEKQARDKGARPFNKKGCLSR